MRGLHHTKNTTWETALDRMLAMPSEQVNRLEHKLLALRASAGVTVAQMELLRAIAARRAVQSWPKNRATKPAVVISRNVPTTSSRRPAGG